jgi:sugar lactone lactonase YvrE
MKVSAFSCLRMVRLFASFFQLRRSILPAVLCAFAALLACPLARAQSAAYSGVERTVYSASGASPMGVAVDTAGTVYIADYGTNRVLKETLWLSGTGFNPPTTVGPQNGALSVSPIAVAVDTSFNVYIVDGAAHRLIKETWNSGSSTYSESVVTSNLTTPQAIAVDASQNIYIVDKGTEAVTLEHYASGSYSRVLLTTVTNSVTLHDPRGIVVDGSGNLFITDNANGNLIQALYGSSVNDYTATVVGQVASGTAPDPAGIAIDASHNLYITGFGTNSNEPLYLETASGGTYAESDVATTPLAGSTGVAVDGSGNIYIADTGNGRVIEEMRGAAANLGAIAVGSASAPITMLFTFYGESTVSGISPVVLTQGETGLDFQIVPSGSTGAGGTCAWNGTGYIYNPSSGDSRYLFCSVNLTLTPAFPGARYGAVVLQQASSTIATGYAYGSGLGPQLVFTNTIQVPGSPDGSETAAQGIASDSVGNLYVSDSGGVYGVPNGDGVPIQVSTHTTIHGTAVDGAGNVYLADTSNNMVWKAALVNGAYTTPTAVVTDCSTLSGPQGVAVDGSGNVYIADTVHNTVWKAALVNGSYLAPTSVTSTVLSGPQGVAVDGSGNVYIADTGHGQILKETPSDGSYSETIPITGLPTPIGVAVDGAGNLFISESGYILMELYQGGNTYSATALQSSVGSPTGVAVDGAGDVFYANGGTISQLTMSTPPSPRLRRNSRGLLDRRAVRGDRERRHDLVELPGGPRGRRRLQPHRLELPARCVARIAGPPHRGRDLLLCSGICAADRPGDR